MTLEKIKELVDLAVSLDDLDDPRQMDNFDDNVYRPIRKAVANNDKTVIDYINNCTPNEMWHVYTPVAAGAKDGRHLEAVQLYVKICSLCDCKVKDWAKELLSQK